MIWKSQVPDLSFPPRPSRQTTTCQRPTLMESHPSLPLDISGPSNVIQPKSDENPPRYRRTNDAHPRGKITRTYYYCP
ncbi:hypothetical protein GBA52_011566 [Prunus armeniaca]|nr:hypothetical protein GBA52_011566 [Prunus armeniaca]